MLKKKHNNKDDDGTKSKQSEFVMLSEEFVIWSNTYCHLEHSRENSSVYAEH